MSPLKYCAFGYGPVSPAQHPKTGIFANPIFMVSINHATINNIYNAPSNQVNQLTNKGIFNSAPSATKTSIIKNGKIIQQF